MAGHTAALAVIRYRTILLPCESPSRSNTATHVRATGQHWGGPVIIFDCNGVLVDSEPIAAAVAAQEFARAGIPVTPEIISRYFFGRRPADMFAAVEAATRRKLPDNFAAELASATIARFGEELRPMPHMAYALTWLRGPKCVASSSPIERIRASLEATDLMRFFEPNLFTASDVAHGKPSPDLLLYAAGRMEVRPPDCIVVEDSPAGVTAAVTAGMRAIGFVGGSHSGSELGQMLVAAGATTIIADMRQLKNTVIALRGW
jgi:HAD superfamily hydrolase (TIGR01509 family)